MRLLIEVLRWKIRILRKVIKFTPNAYTELATPIFCEVRGEREKLLFLPPLHFFACPRVSGILVTRFLRGVWQGVSFQRLHLLFILHLSLRYFIYSSTSAWLLATSLSGVWQGVTNHQHAESKRAATCTPHGHKMLHIITKVTSTSA